MTRRRHKIIATWLAGALVIYLIAGFALVLGLDAVSLHVADLATHGAAPARIKLSADVRTGGRLQASGQFSVEPLATDLNVTVSDLSLKPAQTFLSEVANLEIDSALASATGRLRYGMAKSAGADLVYEGKLALSKVLIAETGPRSPLIAADLVTTREARLTLGPNSLEIAELGIEGLETKLLIGKDRTVNLAQVLKERPPVSPAATEADPFRVSIARIRLEQSGLEFSDLSLRPQFAVRVRELAGTIAGVSSESSARSRLQLDGRVDEFGFARIRGDLKLLAPEQYADVAMTFRNLEMTALTPYTSKFAGYRIASGKLSMDLKYVLKDKHLVGQNQIVLDKLELGEKVDSPDALDLPLELAIALLKDDQGRINVGLPVEGSLDDPQFNFGERVGKAFGNLIGGIVAAPFKMLAAIFGGGSEQLEHIEFDPGSTRLLPPERQKLRTIAAALAKRPQLALNIKPGIAVTQDAAAMRLVALRRDVFTRMGTQLEPGEDPGPVDFANRRVQRAIDDVYAERLGLPALRDRRAAFAQLAASEVAVRDAPPQDKPAPEPAPDRSPLMYRNLFEQLLETGSSAPDHNTLAELGRQRGKAVAAELITVGGVAADRVSVIAAAPADGASTTAIPTTLELVVAK